MKYTNSQPDEVPAPDKPTQTDLLVQIEGDHYAAQQNNDKATMKVLDERHRLVAAAKTDAAARSAYDKHVAESADGQS